MKRVLITGGTGFVGGRLARRLSGEYEVFLSSRKRPGTGASALYGEVKLIEHEAVLAVKTFPEVDTVIHLAALNELDSVKFPEEAVRVNVDQTQLILENSIANGVQQFLYFSTAHIYGSPLRGLISEETIPNPVHPYAATHYAAERLISKAVKGKRINGTVLRLSNSFGAPVSPDVNRWTLLANDLCRQAVETGQMKLTSNGCQYRDFICLTDVEEVVASILSRKTPLKHITYNLGSGLSMRVIDMASIIEKIAVTVLNKNIPVALPAYSNETVEPMLEFSIKRLLDEGFRIQHDVYMEIERLLQFCKEQFAA